MTSLELLQKRRSVRSYTLEPLDIALINKLKAELTMTNTHEAGLKFQLILNDSNPFDGFTKSYGAFLNPRNYVAAVVDTATPNVYERAGYYAEKFVIKATELGLGTCFVGGTYDSKSVNVPLRAGEKILFIILVGHPYEKTRFAERMLVKMVHLKKMLPKDFFEPSSEYEFAISQFPELSEGLAAVACAPSAVNKRPARVCINEIEGIKKLCAKVNEVSPKNLIDLGIAKFNFNYATSTQCEWGNGSPLNILNE